MKKLVLSLITLSSISYACPTLEAQVQGTITSKTQNGSECSYGVAVNDLNQHALCPLTVKKIETNSLKASCDLSLGDSFYRIMVLDTSSNELFLD